MNAPLAERLHHWRGQGIELPVATMPAAGAGQPFWVQLPSWLAGSGRPTRGAELSSRVMRDIQSGQYALFLVARLQDDTVDGARLPGAAVYAADDLLMAAEQQFVRLLSADAWFWRRFRECVTEAARAAAAADQRQRRPGGMNRSALHLYGRMSRMLVVSAAAVCAIRRRHREFAGAVQLAHELAIAGQIVDDLFDLDEDLATGRFNFVANCLGIADLHGSTAATGRLGRAVIVDDAIGGVLKEVDRHLDRAAEIAAAMNLQGAIAHIETLRVHSHAISTALQRTRVDHLFAGFGRAKEKRTRRSSRASGRRRAVA